MVMMRLVSLRVVLMFHFFGMAGIVRNINTLTTERLINKLRIL